MDPRRVSISEIVGTLQNRLKRRGGLGRKNREIIRGVVSELEGQVGGHGEQDLGGLGSVPASLGGEFVHHVPRRVESEG